MCGIAGYFSSRFSEKDLHAMILAIGHRGPDAKGFFLDEVASVGLAHARLSILDLSSAGNQPMHSHNGNCVVVFNGEIYNYRELASQLKNPLRSRSDTEVLLELFADQGEYFVNQLNGMFAMAIYDRTKQELVLYRDRFGIKPLYYFWDGQHFAFASELKALLKIDIPRSINDNALRDYLFLEYIPGCQSILKNIYRLEAGKKLVINSAGIKMDTFYDLLQNIDDQPISMKENDIRERFSELFHRSVQSRMVSDVPLGAFLSGGMDSSLVCASLMEQLQVPVHTYNIGFDDPAYDESPFAEEVAQHLGCSHTTARLTGLEASRLAEGWIRHYDEPFAVPSVIPMLMVSQLARKDVKVALSGDGGDELLMGYGYYRWPQRLKWMKQMPGTGHLLSLLSAIPLRWKHSFSKARRILDYDDEQRIWIHLWSQEQGMFTEKEVEDLMGGHYHHYTLMNEWKRINETVRDPWQRISLFDMGTYLQHNLLYKTDIGSMAHGLEVRTPFLDHELVEFALNMPVGCKIRKGIGKWVGKKMLENYLPSHLVYRKKWGFPAPMGTWLKKDLGWLFDKYLDENLTKKIGAFNKDTVRRLVLEFQRGNHSHHKKIWAIIAFHIWYNTYIEKLID